MTPTDAEAEPALHTFCSRPVPYFAIRALRLLPACYGLAAQGFAILFHGSHDNELLHTLPGMFDFTAGSNWLLYILGGFTIAA